MNFLKSLTQSFRRERTPADLARWLAEPEAELRAWLGSIPPYARGYDYARFHIPKRRGGLRRIEAPGPKLKALQRRVLLRLLNPLPQPPAVTGYVPGRSIVDHARPHVGQGVVINLDLADFFPCISVARVEAVFVGLGWNADAARILGRICTSEGRLPQGAPTSPALSNLVCRKLDVRLAALMRRYSGQYTRYADDLTFSLAAFGKNKRLRPHARQSGPARRKPSGPSRRLLTTVRTIIEDEGFELQLKKRVRVQRAHQRQTATGLVVNRQVNLPRRTRRLIRAMQHRQRLGQLDLKGQQRLRGLEAFQKMVLEKR
jgi:RNA-directed DNA polymerase